MLSALVMSLICSVLTSSFNTYIVDGHSIDDLAKALHAATTVKDKPTCILAKTFKGRGAEGTVPIVTITDLLY